MKSTFDLIPMISVHPSQVNLYTQVQWYPSKPAPRKVEHLLESDKQHHGKFSDNARRKVSRAVDYLLFIADDKHLPDTAHGKGYSFKLAFITLTLPSTQIHPDKEIKEQCLNQLLVELRHRYKVRHYVWRAEKQANSNIHFHLLVDKFIPWSELRDRWNRICNKLGYVDRYRDQMKQFHQSGFKVRNDLLKTWNYKNQVKAWREGKKNDWHNPNSTDIHSLYRIHHVKSYILKYCTKDEKNEIPSGRMWSCNEELSSIKGAQIIQDTGLTDEIITIQKCYPDKLYSHDHCTIMFVDIHTLYDLKCYRLFRHFTDYLSTTFNFNIQQLFPGFL